MTTPLMRASAFILLVFLVALAPLSLVRAQGVRTPDLAENVLRALEAPYLTPEEGADLRTFHGVWRPEDLESPRRRAQAALIVGAYDDPALANPDAAAEDRAEAALQRGDLEESLELLVGAASIRARRIRAEALEGLGRFEEADAAIGPIASELARQRTTSAEDLVEGVRALIIRARINGQPASDYHLMMSLLARARDELDRLYWPANLTEAQLLHAKDNNAEAVRAIEDVLRLNPSCAQAWALRAELSVDFFDFDTATAIGEKLDALSQRFADDDDAFSPLADLFMARVWLRQSEPDLAEPDLAPTLAHFPKMRRALALRCAIEAIRYDIDKTEACLEEYDALSPGSPNALFAVGKALSSARQYEQAANFLERAAARQENWPPPLVELGLLELQSGRDARAASALRRVAELDPFNVRASNSLVLIEELLTYDTIESEHFIVRFQPGVDRVMAQDMLAPLEAIHTIVSTAIDHEPSQKTVIELMPDHQWFAVRITGMPALHTIAAATGPVIAMEAPKIGPRHQGEYDWIRVIRHEYVHTVTLSRTNNRIPHWFTEAAAVYLEGSQRDYNTCRLLVNALETDSLFDMDEINIAFVRPKKASDRSQAYAQGHWMYEHMVERFGADAPLKLMDLYAQGLREDQAMQSVLGISSEDFLTTFKEWARAQAHTWGMLQEPSMRELRFEATLNDDEARAEARLALAKFSRGLGLRVSGVASRASLSFDLISPTAELVEGWLQEHPDHADLLELRAIFTLRDLGDESLTPEAVRQLEEYASVRFVDPMPHRRLARYFLKQEGEEAARRAIEHLDYLDVREQNSPVYAVEIARLARSLNDLDLAAAKATRATQIAPFDAGRREAVATIALLRKDYETAERHIAALVELEPDRDIHKKRLARLRALRENAN